MRTPRAEFLSAALLSGARFIAERVASAGARAWIVGGPVRDLALGREPTDLDMASALPPEAVEGLFERTTPVGRAFGTVLVHTHGLDVQVTTFRRERGFSDARRPDQVEYSDSLEEDARRRDFTCNALYLDPRNDELADPEGGMADIERRVLRAVGEARQRFTEDGLRLVRLARFAAGLDFAVEPATLAGAAASASALVGVSPERRLAELERILGGPRSARAFRLLAEARLFEPLLPGFLSLIGGPGELARRLAESAALEDPPPGPALGLAQLLRPRRAEERAAALALLEYLRPSRGLLADVTAIWNLAGSLAGAAPGSRSELVRAARDARVRDALRLARVIADPGSGVPESWARALAALRPDDLHPRLWITSEDLGRSGIPRGPRWGELLAAAETLQLDGVHASREQALAWLRERAPRPDA